jgi:hypothetical protein
MPSGMPRRHALLAPGRALGDPVRWRRTAFDPVAACAQVTGSSSYPGVAEWTDYFRHARATDVGALAIMAPRDGSAWPATVS